jgi:hypothetical protein
MGDDTETGRNLGPGWHHDGRRHKRALRVRNDSATREPRGFKGLSDLPLGGRKGCDIMLFCRVKR